MQCRYLWITIVYNVTYTVALYALLLFYLGAHDLLAPYNPLLKFVLVKSVIFMTFWQVSRAVLHTSSMQCCACQHVKQRSCCGPLASIHAVGSRLVAKTTTSTQRS